MRAFVLASLAIFGLASVASADLVGDASLVMRLRADSGVTVSDGIVTYWGDMTANNNDAAPPDGWGSGVTYSAAGFGPQKRPYLGFTEMQALQVPNPFSGDDPRTIFAVIQVDSTLSGVTGTGNVVGVPGPAGDPGKTRWFVLQERTNSPTGYPYLSGYYADLNSGVTVAPVGVTAIGATYDGTTAGLYWQVADGTPGSTSKALTLDTYDLPLLIGAHNYLPGGYGFIGKVAEIAVYNRALSAAEMAQNQAYYVSRYAVPEPGMFTMLSISLISLLAYAWRKRR